MIHFAPLQSLNKQSKSSYSIYDQLSLNPNFSTADSPCTRDHINNLIKFMREEWKMLSITDMVYNHTASDSDWIKQHPEASYNLQNSPHLKPAYLLDRLVCYISLKVATDQLENIGIPAKLDRPQHVDSLKDYLMKEVNKLQLHQFYTVDIDKTLNKFLSALHEAIDGVKLSVPGSLSHIKQNAVTNLSIQQDVHFRREHSSVDVKVALLLYTNQLLEISSKPKDDIIAAIIADFEQRLVHLNEEKKAKVQLDVDAAINNVIQGILYRFIHEHGEKIGQVTLRNPLVQTYFVNKKNGYIPSSLDDDVTHMEQSAKYIMACNGWVMGDNPLKNFALPDSSVYLRRELVVWGDCLKLRYGDKPEDSPHLWQRMEEYTRQTVEIFHGIRLDNCHSTPLHVAEHMMKLARRIRPNLYVVAELFTSNESTDNIFVNRLGLNSLIREALSSNSMSDLGRMVHRYGGKPVGSFVQPSVQVLAPSVAHALFMDATHDNESITAKQYGRTINDSLPLAAAVAMSCCAVGSNRGFDEFIPHHIDIVQETRLYSSWSTQPTDLSQYCSENTGIISAKKVLNSLHQYMGDSGYSQVYVHDLSASVVSVTRHSPLTHKSVIGVVRSASNLNDDVNPNCDHLSFEGNISTVKLYSRVEGKCESPGFTKHDKYLNGLTSYITNTQTDVDITDIHGLEFSQITPTMQQIVFNYFPPGTVLIISVEPNADLTDAVTEVFKSVSAINSCRAGCKSTSGDTDEIGTMMSKLTLSDLNVILYHCEAEESVISGFGSYNVPDYGPLVYAGLQGIFSVMSRIRSSNDLGHPLCQNIRAGNWLFEYTTSRLAAYPSLKQFSEFVTSIFKPVMLLPRYLIPCYFDILMAALSLMIYQTAWSKLGMFASQGSPLAKELALCTLQFCGKVGTAQLAKLTPSLELQYKHPVTEEVDLVSISAGLPHFSEGLMRIWGRDTFIALRGLMLVTERFHEAKAIILSFAATLRHGLIPNLHGEGVHARYNCRDAVWWWFQAIQDYCSFVPQGHEIFKEELLRIFHTDDSEPYGAGYKTQPLAEVMQEALQRHADGIYFRERNAGKAIDEHMREEGFTVEAGIDWNTGFVFGGNSYNCGTWMDKMGSSDKAGNKGKPATPSICLNYSLVKQGWLGSGVGRLVCIYVKWLSDLSKKNKYPFEGVAVKKPEWSHSQLVTFSVWSNLIERNFEKYFFVDGTYTSTDVDPHPELINKHNIYKDLVGSSTAWTDYQLRPNFPIAIVVAPHLFTTEKAVVALEMVETHLVGPLGLKTLDSSDWNYNGDYLNNDDSDNYKTARGFNYHNGPEWLWPLGYFMRASLVIAERLESQTPGTIEKTVMNIEHKLANHHLALLSTDWKSLPELTNTNGQKCMDSCPAQAWSISCILDVLYDIKALHNRKNFKFFVTKLYSLLEL
ncbi:AGL [Bugula neritina]|uniref:Glycogen debranching enzyme n=1 Tax=Bugula neritina TaxID=10212 RepID=A0A7J7IY89_BUGNE|nr:AGL [Bugula neritina]